MTTPTQPVAYAAYQKLAGAYAAKAPTKPHNAYYERPATLGLLPDVAGKRVLDAGCGPGIYAEELIARGAQVVACDASPRMLELVQERIGSTGQVRRVDLEQPLDMFRDGEFDVVLAPLCMDYIQDWTRLFLEFYRILSPGGVFLMSSGHPSFDAEYFQSDSYFEIEFVECVWRGFGTLVQMPSYRRSLQQHLMAFIDAGFVLERIVEPLPTEEFRLADPVGYDKLMRRPAFLCVRARKF